MERIPRGAVVVPVGNPSVLNRLSGSHSTIPVLNPRSDRPQIAANRKLGLRFAVDAAHRSPAGWVAARQLAGHRPLVGLAETADLEADAYEWGGFDVVIGPRDRFEVIPEGNRLNGLSGGFFVIGDVHNCWRTLRGLLDEAGFDEQLNHPSGMLPVLAGDIVDKGASGGPDAVATLRFVIAAERAGKLVTVRGNHEHRLAECLRTRNFLTNERSGGNTRPTLFAVLGERDGERFASEVEWWARGTPAYLRLPRPGSSDAVVVHARFDPSLEHSGDARDRRIFERTCVFGRRSWAHTVDGDGIGWSRSFDGPELVVHGHYGLDGRTPRRIGNVVNIDTSAAEGFGLTGLFTESTETITVKTVPCEAPAA